MSKISGILAAMLLAVAATLAGMALPHKAHGVTGPIKHVVLIVDENHNAQTAVAGMPWMRSLGTTYTHDWTSYSAITHPSLPNYLALTSGSTWGHTSDCGGSTSSCMVNGNNIYHQATAAGGWSQLSESMPVPCDSNNALPYVVHHAPAPYYKNVVGVGCKPYDVRLNASAVPPLTAGFTFITPNLNDDAHNGTLAQADAWLKGVVTQIMAQPTYQDGSTLIEVVFDEGSSGDNHVSLVLVNPAIKGKTLTGTYDHYSLLRLNEELLGRQLLLHAATANDMRSALGL